MSADHFKPGTDSHKDTYGFFLACLILGLAFFLDAPWGRAFYSYTPITETLGAIYFSSLSDSLGLQGVSVSPFELFSSLLALSCLFKVSASLSDDTSKNIFIAMIASIVLIFFAGITSGLAQGNNFRIMLTQTRSIISLPIWLIIGTTFLTSPRRAWTFLFIIASATFAKSLQGLWNYIFILDRQRGDQEYIIEHITSSFIVTALMVINALIWLKKIAPLTKIILSVSASSILVYVFFVNDRRAALVGLAIGVGMILFSIPAKHYRRHFLPLSTAMLLVTLYLAATWDSSGALGFPVRTLKSLMDPSESSAGYRQVENANLLFSIANEPLAGLGFGRRFPLIFPLPSISNLYSEYDLVPHNTLLFVWTFAGPLGIAGLGTFFATALSLAVKVLRRSSNLDVSILGGIAVFILIQALSYIYADIGLREVRLMAEVGGVSGYLLAFSKLSLKVGDI